MRSNYTDDKPRTINSNTLINVRRHVGQDDKVWSALVMLLARRTEKWWGSVMDVGLDPELTKWSVRSGPAIVLTGKGYKEHHWLVVPPSTTSVISIPTSTTTYSIMPMSARTIPGTVDQYGRGRAAVRVRGQTGNRTNAGRATTPFMFNEEGYHVSSFTTPCYTCSDLVIVCT